MPRHDEQKRNKVTFSYALDETVSDADVVATPEKDGDMPGCDRWENAKIGEGVYKSQVQGGNLYLHGKCKFRWVLNRSGGTLPQGAGCSFRNVATATATGGSTTTIEHTAQFTANEEVGNMVHILDDAGAAGAAPEGEWGIIVANTANIITVRTGMSNQRFSVAPAAGDTYVIRSRHQVIPMNTGVEQQDFAGVVVRSGGLADNYWGWVAYEAEMVGALAKAATAITAGLGIIAADDADGATVALSRFINSGAGAVVAGTILGVAQFAVSADIASDLFPASLRPVGMDEA